MTRAASVGRILRCAVVAIALLGATGCGGDTPSAGADTAGLHASLPDLGDVPEGYRVGDDSDCGPLGREGATPALADLLERSFPSQVTACRREFNWAWRTPGANPTGISVYMLRWPDGDLAAAGLATSSDLSLWLAGIRLTPTRAPGQIGDESLALEGQDAGTRPATPVRALAWRDGVVTGLILATGTDVGASEQTAERIARLTSTRLDRRDPSASRDLDDRLVPIDDPGLDVPVWWLGERWSGPGLPELEVASTFAPIPVDARTGPGNSVEVQYRQAAAGAPPSGGLVVLTWTPGNWQRFAASRLGRQTTKPRCAVERSVTLGGRGSAMIVTIEEGRRHDSAPCPESSDATITWVIARLDDAVVTVNLPICLNCFVRGVATDPYDTPEGMEAVAGALVRRP